MAEDSKKLYEELDAAQLLEHSGLLFEINRIVLHPIGYHMESPVVDGRPTLRIIDYANVEGGIAFGSAEWREGKEKLKAFSKARGVVRRISQRLRAFGAIIQEDKSFGPLPSGGKDTRERRPGPARRR